MSLAPAEPPPPAPPNGPSSSDTAPEPEAQAARPEPPPARPAAIPDQAIWLADEMEWRLGPIDAAGNLHGSCRWWRADGTLRTICSYQHGKQEGPWYRFHPDGALHSVGCFSGGAAHGVLRLYGSESPSTERLQSCCVPPGAWQLRIDYHHGESAGRRWYSRAGYEILPSGEPFPERPASVPRDASFDEEAQQWDHGLHYEEVGVSGTQRRWSREGVLRFEAGMRRGQRHGSFRAFDAAGAPTVEAVYVEGRLHGPWRALGLPPGRYLDPQVGSDEGTFADDQAVGAWRFRDAGGAVRAERDLGLASTEDGLAASPALGAERRPPAAWLDLADALGRERRVGEALLAAARASAAAGSAGHLLSALERAVFPLGVEDAAAHANAVAGNAGGKLVPLVDGLRRGYDPGILLRALASSLKGTDRAALDLVTAALLVAPGRNEALLTRALIHAALGDVAAARADVARLAAESPERAEPLELYLRVSFPRFEFWPARDGSPAVTGTDELGASDDDIGPLQPARDLADVRETIQRYATRLMRLRAALRARITGDPPFMVPDLGALLPDGPLPLRRFTFTMTAEEYSGGELPEETADNPEAQAPVEIAVDEEGGLAALAGAEAEALQVPALLQQARTDWSGLCWLCWSVGAAAVTLPDELHPPAAFARAAATVVQRTWRCQDRARTGGLLALSNNVPAFQWEGMSIDDVPSVLISVAIDEHLEARAVFSWLCDPSNRSLWQEDLRTADA
jgi:hypothetical protein